MPGRCESSKSTLLTFLLRHGGVAFVANDRVLLDGKRRVVGVPTLISIRAGTFAHVPDLPPIPWPRRFRHRYRLVELERAPCADPGVAQPATFTGEQYLAWVGASATRDGRAVAILFPEAGTSAAGPHLEPLSLTYAHARASPRSRVRPDPRGFLAGPAAAGEAAPASGSARLSLPAGNLCPRGRAPARRGDPGERTAASDLTTSDPACHRRAT